MVNASRRSNCWVVSCWMAILVVAGAVAFFAPVRPACAQTLVVAPFTDKTGKVKLGKKAWTAIANALTAKGAKLVAYDQYVRTAKKHRIPAGKALLPANVKKLSAALKLDGVVTGSAVPQKKKKFAVTVQLLGTNGKVLAKKAYSLAKPALPEETATEVADEFFGKLPSAEVAAAPTEPKTPPPPETPPSDKPAEGGGSDAFLPPWARAGAGGTGSGSGSGGTGGGTTAAAGGGTSEPAATEVKEKAPEPKKKGKLSTGAVPDILVDAGMSFNMRAGLSPRHESGLFPGIWADGRFFLGTLLDLPVVRDIGLGGSFNMALALKYSRQGLSDDWTASQMQWKGELMYRLAFNDVTLGPAFLFRFGFGSTSCTIDTTDSLAKDASYMYPYGALDIYLMLWKPMLRLHLTGGFLFTLMTGKEVTGSGMGFEVGAGIDFVLFEMLNIGVGWDMVQVSGFKMNEADANTTSDMYHAFMAKVGWAFH